MHSVRAPAIGLIKRKKSARVNPPGHRIPDDDQNVGVGDPRLALVEEHLVQEVPGVLRIQARLVVCDPPFDVLEQPVNLKVDRKSRNRQCKKSST